MEPSQSCPLPHHDQATVKLAHGGGGRLMQQLIDDVFVRTFDNPFLAGLHDGAVIETRGQRLAMTTDSYVVRPLFFSGGDIGSLAVNGTVNDLAMCGARPRWLSTGFIIEEGLPMETLVRVAESMQRAAVAAGVQIVTGDTKVVDKGKGDGVFINTAGVGVIEHNREIAPSEVMAEDVILLSGDIGRHGMAVMSAREGLEFETTLESDCAPLVDPVFALLDAGIEVHCLRDLTRGGLASALNEIATAANVQIDIDETAVPVDDAVRGACEILGMDPLYVANEGRFIVIIPRHNLTEALALLHDNAVTVNACLIGSVGVGSGDSGLVTLKTALGSQRVLDLLSGEQLPRIC